MEERLFEAGKKFNIEQLVSRINEIIDEKFTILDEKDDIEKWNGIPKLLLLDEKTQNRVLEFVDFMDSLLVPIEEKTIYIVSLSGLIEFGKISLDQYDLGSLFTMADYYQNSSISEIKNTLILVGNPALLNAIRCKTLELDTRKEILKKVVNRFFETKRTKIDNKTITKYLNDAIQQIQTLDYYELVK